jgi:hypothetical protein
MSTQTFYIAQGDLLPVIEYVPQDGDGNDFNVMPGDSVVFSMRNTRTGLVKISRAAASIEGGNPKYFRYVWASGDTSEAGTYDAEWELTEEDKKVTFPNNRRSGLRVEIADDIA